MRLILRGIVTFSVLILFAVACRDDSGLVSETPAVPLSPADNLYQMAEKFREDAKYDSAIVLYEAAKALYREDGDKVRLVTCMNHVGDCLRRKGKYDDAWAHLDSTLSLGKRYFGEQDTVVAKTYHHMGAVKWKKGEFNEAMALYEKSLEINIPILGEIHPDVAYSYNNIGIIHWNFGDFEKSMFFFTKSLESRLSIKHTDSLDIAQSHNNVGMVHRRQGRYANALSHYTLALSIRTRILGPDHPAVALNYESIGIVQSLKGQYFQALKAYERCLQIRNVYYGDNHPKVAQTLNNMGIVYRKVNERKRANICFSAALKILDDPFGDVIVAHVHHNLGQLYLADGDLKRALFHLFKSLEFFEQKYGSSHISVAESWKAIGDVYLVVPALDSAESCYQKALDIAGFELGFGHPVTGDCVLGLGRVRAYRKDFDESLELANRAKDIFIGSGYDKASSRPWLAGALAGVDKLRLVKAIGLMSESLFGRYQRNKNVEDLVLAFKYVGDILNVIDLLRTDWILDLAEQQVGEIVERYFAFGIELCLLLNKVTGKEEYKFHALECAEKSKSVVLARTLLTQRSLSFSGVPDSVKAVENEFLSRMRFMNQSILEERSGKEVNNQKVSKFEDHFVLIKQKYLEFRERIRLSNPEYFKVRYAPSPPSLDDIRRNLLRSDSSSFLLEFFVADSSVVLFWIGSDVFEVVDLPIHRTDLADLVDVDLFGNKKQTSTESPNSKNRWYSMISRAISSFFSQDINSNTDYSVRLIPDGSLGYFPFEMVEVEPSRISDISVRKTRFFGQLFSISYGYSCSNLLFAMSRPVSVGQETVMGFSPKFKHK